MEAYIRQLNWRYATKQFDPHRKLTDEQLDYLKESLRLTASSLGLQPYRVLVISNPDLRKKLKSVSWNQPQITDASHLFVLCAKTTITESDIEEYLQLVAGERQIKRTDLDGYASMIKGSVQSKSTEELTNWNARQCYIALGNLLSACAVAHIDACPMEGFSAEQYDELLGLKDKKLTACVVTAVGFRSTEDKYQHLKKVRKPAGQLFEDI